jgi:hypothetical protein
MSYVVLFSLFIEVQCKTKIVVGVDVGCAVVNHQCLILFLQESNNIIKWLMLALKNKRGNYVFKIIFKY